MKPLFLVIFMIVSATLGALSFLLRVLVIARGRPQHAKHLQIAGVVFCWTGASVSFPIINGWLYKDWHGGLPFPIVNTFFKAWGQLAASTLSLWFLGIQPLNGQTVVAGNPEHIPIGSSPSLIFLRPTKLLCVWSDGKPCGKGSMLRHAFPVGALGAADRLLMNASFRFLQVAFLTIVKSGNLTWLFMWAVLLGLERLRWDLLCSVVVICVGLALSCQGEAEFSMVGLFLAVGSSCAGGLRWALTQRLKDVDPQFGNVLLTVYCITFSSALCMTLGVFLELPAFLDSQFWYDATIFWEFIGISAGGGILSFMLITLEVKLIQLTSSLTMAVFGSLREMVLIGLAVLTLRETVSITTFVGLLLGIGGSWMYNISISKPQKPRQHRDDSEIGFRRVDSGGEEVDMDSDMDCGGEVAQDWRLVEDNPFLIDDDLDVEGGKGSTNGEGVTI